MVDILVYRERVLLGRRVFLDYENGGQPRGTELPFFRFEDLSEEALGYLENSGALFGLPSTGSRR